MCVAIYKPAKVKISQDTLWDCFQSNPDSMGLAVAKDGRIIIKRSLNDFHSFYQEDYLPLEQYPMIVHFRICTHGTVTLKNCHPFTVNKGELAVIHNGIISGITDAAGKKSDTNVYVHEYLQPILNEFPAILQNQPFLSILGASLGTFNKLVFLASNGDHAIVNEDEGTWIDKVWYSNTHWKFSNSYQAWGEWVMEKGCKTYRKRQPTCFQCRYPHCRVEKSGLGSVCHIRTPKSKKQTSQLALSKASTSTPPLDDARTVTLASGKKTKLIARCVDCDIGIWDDENSLKIGDEYLCAECGRWTFADAERYAG